MEFWRTPGRIVALVCLPVLLLGVGTAAAQTVVGAQCLGDKDASGDVTVDEVVTTVDNALNGCGLEEITVEFQGMVGDQTFACGQIYENLGLSGDQFIPADFRLYFHNIRLIDKLGREVPLQLTQDGIWQVEDLVMLDFENRVEPCNLGTVQTNTSARGRIAPGEYNGIRFSLGVPFRLDHINAATAPSPLTLTAMFWNWQGGYKFIRIDEALDIFRVHLGSSGCVLVTPSTVSHCDRPNVGEVYLPVFDPSTDIIAADLKVLLADSDLQVNQPDTPPGCMSTPEDTDCDPVMRNLGVNFSNGMPDPSRQKFFHVLD